MRFLLVSFLSFPALAAVQPAGEFSYKHDVGFLAYDKAGCLEEKGRWSDEGNPEEGVCLFDGEDTLSVSAEGDRFRVAISTVTTNAHECSFEAPGTLVGGEIQIASPSEEWVPEQGGMGGRFVPATCELRVRYADDGSASVSYFGERGHARCASFCGANAGLEIRKAVRK